MTYAGTRDILDADSHLMELDGFLDPFIDPSIRGRLRRQSVEGLRPVLEDATGRAEARRSDATKGAEAEERLLVDKGWRAMGAFDREERSRVLDLLGFRGQLVFATFASALFAGKDLDRLYGGSQAQNLAMADFCSADPRLLPVAFVPLVVIVGESEPRRPERIDCLAQKQPAHYRGDPERSRVCVADESRKPPPFRRVDSRLFAGDPAGKYGHREYDSGIEELVLVRKASDLLVVDRHR